MHNSLQSFCPLTALSSGSWLSSPPMLRADIEVVSSLSAPSWTASSWFLLFPFFFFSTGAAPGSLKGEESWWVISRSRSVFPPSPEAGKSTVPWGFVESCSRQLHQVQRFYPRFVLIFQGAVISWSWRQRTTAGQSENKEQGSWIKKQDVSWF